MHASTSRMYPSVAAAVAEVGGSWRFGGVLAKTRPVGADLGIGSESGVYSPALHQCQRGLRFEEQLYYHYRLIN